MVRFTSLLMACLVVAIASATAANAEGEPVNFADATGVEPSPHYRVEDGIFALRIGMSVDLSDRQVLLAFQEVSRLRRNRPPSIRVTINGKPYAMSVGTRIDMLAERNLQAAVEGKARCFLDMTDLTTAKGAPVRATFRVNCI